VFPEVTVKAPSAPVPPNLVNETEASSFPLAPSLGTLPLSPAPALVVMKSDAAATCPVCIAMLFSFYFIIYVFIAHRIVTLRQVFGIDFRFRRKSERAADFSANFAF
jgi:hypothetical protein